VHDFRLIVRDLLVAETLVELQGMATGTVLPNSGSGIDIDIDIDDGASGRLTLALVAATGCISVPACAL